MTFDEAVAALNERLPAAAGYRLQHIARRSAPSQWNAGGSHAEFLLTVTLGGYGREFDVAHASLQETVAAAIDWVKNVEAEQPVTFSDDDLPF